MQLIFFEGKIRFYLQKNQQLLKTKLKQNKKLCDNIQDKIQSLLQNSNSGLQLELSDFTSYNFRAKFYDR